MIEERRGFPDHEAVIFEEDPATGLRSIIALHDTRRGPAVGGCRMLPYASEHAAVEDVLRLSRAMTYKTALASLPYGGGKSVIVGDPRRDKSSELLAAFGRFVSRLKGRYVVAEDSGIRAGDLQVVAQHCPYVAGMRDGRVEDPSPMTALGVLEGIRVGVQRQLGRSRLDGVAVAVQGVGSVGRALCGLLAAEGAQLTVADADPEATLWAVRRFGARVTTPREIFEAPVDVFAPCALGGALSGATVARLRAEVVAGAANNQLADSRAGDLLWERGILYLPDFVVNAGGVIHGCLSHEGRDAEMIRDQVRAIGARVDWILRISGENGQPSHRVAEALAEQAIDESGRSD